MSSHRTLRCRAFFLRSQCVSFVAYSCNDASDTECSTSEVFSRRSILFLDPLYSHIDKVHSCRWHEERRPTIRMIECTALVRLRLVEWDKTSSIPCPREKIVFPGSQPTCKSGHSTQPPHPRGLGTRTKSRTTSRGFFCNVWRRAPIDGLRATGPLPSLSDFPLCHTG